MNDTRNITGSKTPALTIHNVSYSDTGLYSCRIVSYYSENPGSLSSTEASLSIDENTGLRFHDNSLSASPIHTIRSNGKTVIQLNEKISKGEVYNLTGKRIMELRNTRTLDLTGQPDGVYFILTPDRT
ncbi:hypothetical protein CHISP_3234 [Chitinispirillum alkaliphilum]|nr:hypothetical protein CHISP_3234 [Chitinispirillum alkaliphilum]